MKANIEEVFGIEIPEFAYELRKDSAGWHYVVMVNNEPWEVSEWFDTKEDASFVGEAHVARLRYEAISQTKEYQTYALGGAR